MHPPRSAHSPAYFAGKKKIQNQNWNKQPFNSELGRFEFISLISILLLVWYRIEVSMHDNWWQREQRCVTGGESWGTWLGKGLVASYLVDEVQHDRCEMKERHVRLVRFWKRNSEMRERDSTFGAIGFWCHCLDRRKMGREKFRISLFYIPPTKTKIRKKMSIYDTVLY